MQPDVRLWIVVPLSVRAWLDRQSFAHYAALQIKQKNQPPRNIIGIIKLPADARMPKVKRNGGELPQDGKKPRLDLDITTDVNKTLCENVENRFQHWEKVDQEIVKKQDRIYQLKTCLQV